MVRQPYCDVWGVELVSHLKEFGDQPQKARPSVDREYLALDAVTLKCISFQN